MQPSHNELKEIIYEICNTCNNNCSYCGSKEHNCKPLPSYEHIKGIVDKISMYPPKEVNISGGDPLLVSHTTHIYVTNTLRDVGCVMKLIVNPKSVIEGRDMRWMNKETFDLYDVIGMSINNKEEIDKFRNFYVPMGLSEQNKVTIITNFNVHNVWEYKLIEGLVNEFNLTWQIQYTMSEIDGIYLNNKSNKYLQQLIKISKGNGTKVVLGDNMNDGPCWAGRNGLGILADGGVVPCLSMRSWDKETPMPIMGNLIFGNLEDIWIYGFSKFRCTPFKCCKDVCKSQCCDEPESDKISTDKTVKNLFDLIDNPLPLNTPYTPPQWDRVFTYGVVPNKNMVIVYGVFTDNTFGDRLAPYTNTTHFIEKGIQ